MLENKNHGGRVLHVPSGHRLRRSPSLREMTPRPIPSQQSQRVKPSLRLCHLSPFPKPKGERTVLLWIASRRSDMMLASWSRSRPSMGWTRRARSPVFDLCRVNDSPSVIPVVRQPKAYPTAMTMKYDRNIRNDCSETIKCNFILSVLLHFLSPLLRPDLSLPIPSPRASTSLLSRGRRKRLFSVRITSMFPNTQGRIGFRFSSSYTVTAVTHWKPCADSADTARP